MKTQVGSWALLRAVTVVAWVTAVAQAQSLAQELPYAAGMAEGRKEERKKVIPIMVFPTQTPKPHFSIPLLTCRGLTMMLLDFAPGLGAWLGVSPARGSGPVGCVAPAPPGGPEMAYSA